MQRDVGVVVASAKRHPHSGFLTQGHLKLFPEWPVGVIYDSNDRSVGGCFDEKWDLFH